MQRRLEQVATTVVRSHLVRCCTGVCGISALDMEGLATSSCNRANSGTKSHAKPEIAARETENVVAHDRGEPSQQATVEQERTMLTPELSRLKAALGAAGVSHDSQRPSNVHI